MIGIGNLSSGGTGKTPMVEYLIRIFSEKYNTVLISRGYKRSTSGYVRATKNSSSSSIGDEPFQIFNKFKNINTAVDSNSNADIVSSGNISTCTFANISSIDSGKSVSVVTDYIPADGEGNANNDNLRSNLAILTSFPEILINTQPTDIIVGSGLESTFNIDAEIFPLNDEILFYQWQIDGKDLVNGSQTLSETTEAESASLTVTSDAGDNFTIDLSLIHI